MSINTGIAAFSNNGSQKGQINPSITFTSRDMLEEGLHGAFCKGINFKYPHATDPDDAAYYESRDIPPVVAVDFETISKNRGHKKPYFISREFDPLTPEGKSGLRSLTRSLVGRPFEGLVDLKGLEGRLCTLIIVHREVAGRIYPAILEILSANIEEEEVFAF
ncbi:MAG: hypothetical protein EB101_07110 [Chitinophagia bacterium]|nr:hypothetical protein [Chitinophagia bacterium]